MENIENYNVKTRFHFDEIVLLSMRLNFQYILIKSVWNKRK